MVFGPHERLYTSYELLPEAIETEFLDDSISAVLQRVLGSV